MRFNDSRGIRNARWDSNEILHSDDLATLNQASYANILLTLATLCKGENDKAYVMGGLNLVWSSAMTTNLQSGIAIDYSGSYLQDNVWGFSAVAGDIFGVFVGEPVAIAFDNGGAQDRIDVVEIRPIQLEYNSETRKFKDPVTGFVTSSAVNTKIEYGYEFQVLKGTEGASPVADTKTAGWIKIAEVYVASGVSVISQGDINGVTSSDDWTTDIKVSLPNRVHNLYTTTERDALINVYVGLMIYNSTQDRINVYANNGGTPRWEYADGTNATI